MCYHCAQGWTTLLNGYWALAAQLSHAEHIDAETFSKWEQCIVWSLFSFNTEYFCVILGRSFFCNPMVQQEKYHLSHSVNISPLLHPELSSSSPSLYLGMHRAVGLLSSICLILRERVLIGDSGGSPHLQCNHDQMHGCWIWDERLKVWNNSSGTGCLCLSVEARQY